MTRISLPPIGLGTGGEESLTGEAGVDIIASGLELGYRHIDTAHMYENHRTVGRGIDAASVPRDAVILADKVLPEDLAPDDVRDRIHESLEAMNVDVIDLAYVHFPSPSYDPEATLGAFQALMNEGLISHIGVSNFSIEQTRTALDVLGEDLVAIQVERHPLHQQTDLLEFAQANGLVLVGYAPLARGAVFENDTLAAIAEKHDTSIAQVSLAWAIAADNAVAIPKTADHDHLEANLAATSLALDQADIERIEAIETETRLVDPMRYLEDD